MIILSIENGKKKQFLWKMTKNSAFWRYKELKLILPTSKALPKLQSDILIFDRVPSRKIKSVIFCNAIFYAEDFV